MSKRTAKKTKQQKGKLRIGDSWNAITIIALSQSNPLKAIAEFVENTLPFPGLRGPHDRYRCGLAETP